MKPCIIILSLLFLSCGVIQVKDNQFKPQMVSIYYGTELADTLPAAEYYELADNAYRLSEIYDAEKSNRIIFTPHPILKNTYVIMWYNKKKEIIKRFQIELYKPIEEPKDDLKNNE
jgi:hypothetical protein